MVTAFHRLPMRDSPMPNHVLRKTAENVYSPAIPVQIPSALAPYARPNASANKEGLLALASLCLVSKRFRCIAQPLLYQEFAMGYGDVGVVYS